jgi:hypothetical protein
VYAARGSEIREYTWNAGERRWRGVLVGRLSSGLAHGVVVGRGRGGAIDHVYVASTTTGTHEATFSNGRWTMRRLGDGGDVRNVWIGPGRHDRVMRLYAAIASPASMGIREFTWTRGGWRIQRIASPVGLIHAEVARGRNDGIARLYGAGIEGSAFEFTRRPGGWVRREIGRADEYLYGLHFGMLGGRIQVFGASFDARVYRYSWG